MNVMGGLYNKIMPRWMDGYKWLGREEGGGRVTESSSTILQFCDKTYVKKGRISAKGRGNAM